MQQMIVQTAIPNQPTYSPLFKPAFQEKSKSDASINNPQSCSLKDPSKSNDDSIAITPFNHRQTMLTRNSTNEMEDDGESQWPQIESIVTKIRSLQLKLKDTRKANAALLLKIGEYEAKIEAFEQLKAEGMEKLAAQQQNTIVLDQRIKQLEAELSQKQNQLAQKQHLIEEIQFAQVKKRAEFEEKLKKASADNKELLDKLRKANLQLQKERKAYKVLKQSMTSQLQSMKPQREQELVQQIQTLKQVISHSKQQREVQLYKQIDKLSRQLYLKQEQIKRINIELNLSDRKKHQAVSDIIQKKDAEIKVQKTLFKSLNQKMLKLQEEIKTNKICHAQQMKGHRFQRNYCDRDEEISFHLSPDKE